MKLPIWLSNDEWITKMYTFIQGNIFLLRKNIMKILGKKDWKQSF